MVPHLKNIILILKEKLMEYVSKVNEKINDPCLLSVKYNINSSVLFFNFFDFGIFFRKNVFKWYIG